jgi:hypothetical protein
MPGNRSRAANSTSARLPARGHRVARVHQRVGALPDDAFEGAIEFINVVSFRPKRCHAKLLGGGPDLATAPMRSGSCPAVHVPEIDDGDAGRLRDSFFQELEPFAVDRQVRRIGDPCDVSARMCEVCRQAEPDRIVDVHHDRYRARRSGGLHDSGTGGYDHVDGKPDHFGHHGGKQLRPPFGGTALQCKSPAFDIAPIPQLVEEGAHVQTCRLLPLEVYRGNSIDDKCDPRRLGPRLRLGVVKERRCAEGDRDADASSPLDHRLPPFGSVKRYRMERFSRTFVVGRDAATVALECR